MAEDGVRTAAAGPIFGFDNSYARDLPGFFVEWRAARVPAPRLVRLNAPWPASWGWMRRRWTGTAGRAGVFRQPCAG